MKKIPSTLLSFYLLVCSACQTTPPVYLPQSLTAKFFKSCGDTGDASFKLFYKSKYLISGFIDWDLQDGIYITSVVGNPLATIERKEISYVNLQNSFFKIEIDEDEKIIIANKFIGLYFQEFLCVLGGMLPTIWHQDLVSSLDNGYLLEFSDSERKITVKLDFNRFKVVVSRRFLWLFSGGEITLGGHPNGAGYFSGHGFRLNWQQTL